MPTGDVRGGSPGSWPCVALESDVERRMASTVRGVITSAFDPSRDDWDRVVHLLGMTRSGAEMLWCREIWTVSEALRVADALGVEVNWEVRVDRFAREGPA